MGSSGIIEMAMGTGLVVKLVLISLVVSSFVAWAIIFAKWSAYKEASKQNVAFLDLFWNGKSLDAIFGETKDLTASPISNIFRAGYQEFQKLSTKGKEKPEQTNAIVMDGLENVQRALKRATGSELLRLEKSLSNLATIASAAPFVGLFGTVWGIMDSFRALGAGGPATLEVVAPGISEALIATAVGLAAAIPAVIFYNQYATKLRGFRSDMDSFSSDFTNILKRSYLG